MNEQQTLFYRDSRGRFTKGNPYRFRTGEARTIEAAKKGFKAMTDIVFDGHKGRAMEWLGLCMLRGKGMLDWE